MFAKFINEKFVEIAPVNKGSHFNYNLDEAAMKADGYKRIVPDILPVSVAMVCPEIRYREKEEVIEQCYVETYVAPPPPPEPTYVEMRAAAYLPIPEQLDMLFWDKKNGTNNWETHIETVKRAFPKPIEEQAYES